ncbi:MAG: hypothetical protein KDD31_13955 [Muricauda sp.]|nr:hypothetical protein [Allomuricauda sp.]
MLSGSAKGAATLQLEDGNSVMLFGMNSGKLKAYQPKNNSLGVVALNADDASAIVTTRNGKQTKYEFPYGNTYLGNSSRTLKYQKENTSEIRITNFRGESRTLDLSSSL